MKEPLTVNSILYHINREEFNDFDIVFSAHVKKGGSTKFDYQELFNITPGRYDIEIKEMEEEVIINVKTMYI